MRARDKATLSDPLEAVSAAPPSLLLQNIGEISKHRTELTKIREA